MLAISRRSTTFTVGESSVNAVPFFADPPSSQIISIHTLGSEIISAMLANALSASRTSSPDIARSVIPLTATDLRGDIYICAMASFSYSRLDRSLLIRSFML